MTAYEKELDQFFQSMPWNEFTLWFEFQPEHPTDEDGPGNEAGLELAAITCDGEDYEGTEEEWEEAQEYLDNAFENRERR